MSGGWGPLQRPRRTLPHGPQRRRWLGIEIGQAIQGHTTTPATRLRPEGAAGGVGLGHCCSFKRTWTQAQSNAHQARKGATCQLQLAPQLRDTSGTDTPTQQATSPGAQSFSFPAGDCGGGTHPLRKAESPCWTWCTRRPQEPMGPKNRPHGSKKPASHREGRTSCA